jgi:predicted O-methyltransferase YrrM
MPTELANSALAEAAAIDGWMSGQELECLQRLATELPAGARVVEVGSWKGRSTVAICGGLAGVQDARMWAVDIFGADAENWEEAPDVDAVYDEFRKHTSRFRFLEVVRQASPGAAAAFDDGSLDWVFIDAHHAYEAVLADIAAWAPKLKAGGLMSGHDFAMPSVRDAVLRSFGEVDSAGEVWQTRRRPRPRAVVELRRIATQLRRRLRSVV